MIEVFRPVEDFTFEKHSFSLQPKKCQWVNKSHDFIIYQKYSSWKKKQVWEWNKYDQEKFNQSFGNCMGRLSHVGDMRINTFDTLKEAHQSVIRAFKNFALEEYLQTMDMSLQLYEERYFQLVVKDTGVKSDICIKGRQNNWRILEYNWTKNMPENFPMTYQTRKQSIESIIQVIANNFSTFYTEKVYQELLVSPQAHQWWMIFLKPEVRLLELY